MNYMEHGWGMGYGMWFTLLLFVFIIFYFLKDNDKDKGKDKTSSAQDILDKRYANGGIDTKEYKEKSNALKKNN